MAEELYDKFDMEAIVEYAQRLEGHSLCELTNLESIADPKQRRGSFGNAVEEYYFGYKPNSDSNPDFAEVNLELKTTPLRRTSSGLVAKERLVLTMIDYFKVVYETFETSHLMRKASQILLISYEWQRELTPLEYKVVAADVWSIPEEDLGQIKQDWNTVVAKVQAGRAHEISCADTLYLEACPKAANAQVRRAQPFSDEPAKPRAWALKSSYMTAQQRSLISRREKFKRSAAEKNIPLQELIRARFEPYLGVRENELAILFAISNSKQRAARITQHILGAPARGTIDEFVKADIRPKTVHMRKNGQLKESISFPYFDYFDVLETEFEDSDFYRYLQRKWLFVIYREDNSGESILTNVVLWQMPESDYEEAKRCYNQMRDYIRAGQASISPKTSENRCCHVRPHGRDSHDTTPQPFGDPVVKKCFWLNARYISEEIRRITGE